MEFDDEIPSDDALAASVRRAARPGAPVTWDNVTVIADGMRRTRVFVAVGAIIAAVLVGAAAMVGAAQIGPGSHDSVQVVTPGATSTTTSEAATTRTTTTATTLPTAAATVPDPARCAACQGFEPLGSNHGPDTPPPSPTTDAPTTTTSFPFPVADWSGGDVKIALEGTSTPNVQAGQPITLTGSITNMHDEWFDIWGANLRFIVASACGPDGEFMSRAGLTLTTGQGHYLAPNETAHFTSTWVPADPHGNPYTGTLICVAGEEPMDSGPLPAAPYPGQVTVQVNP